MVEHTPLDNYVELFDIIEILRKILDFPTDDERVDLYNLIYPIQKSMTEMKEQFLNPNGITDPVAFKKLVMENRDSIRKIVDKTGTWLRKKKQLIDNVQIWRDHLDEFTPNGHGLFQKLLCDSFIASDVEERARRNYMSIFGHCY